MALSAKPYLRSLTVNWDEVDDRSIYPYSIPAIKSLESLDFHADVTFFVGENGMGKSTLLEAIAVALGFNAEGGNKNSTFSTAPTHSPLHDKLHLIKSFSRPKDGYFLRAESFYNLATKMDEVDYLEGYGGVSLHQQSHGESFMATLLNKLRGNGLYLMDEPEAALSPQRQLTALAAIHELVKKDSQFIIATHSPILLAYPNARIISFTEDGLESIAYEDTEHYRVTKGFLDNYPAQLRILMGERH